MNNLISDEDFKSKRNSITEEIINSRHPKKIIVAGPGTGKTFLFNKMVEQKNGVCLVITFITNLVNKLKSELPANAFCCTFHGFCKNMLHKNECDHLTQNFNLYPKLDLIIKSDAQLLFDETWDFKKGFRQMNLNKKAFEFFIKQSEYYNTVSFDDCVYRALEHLKKHPEHTPRYSQILVDEYQDFNKLEVTLIDMLSKKSPILIVGDDDQALYDRKDASPVYIRNKFKSRYYKHFDLPFCSRCTEVITTAINAVVLASKEIGKLKNRIPKEYTCFLPSKRKDSERYPNIIYANCSVETKRAPFVSKFIKQEIDNISGEETLEINKNGANYTVLITGPAHYLRSIYNNCSMENAEKWDVDYKDNKVDEKPTALEGYKLLLSNKVLDIGWRILLESDPMDNEKILKKTFDCKEKLYDCLPEAFIKKHESFLYILNKVKTDSKINKTELKKINSIFQRDLEDLKQYLLDTQDEPLKDNNRLSIKLCSHLGAKGLSAGHVFILGLNEGLLPRYNSNPTDTEICKFIVTLTRATKKCYVISTKLFGGGFAGNRSIFIDWIRSHIEEIPVDKNYWKK